MEAMEKRTSLSFSVRRHFIDDFFLRECQDIRDGGRTIDIGGKKSHKRGLFDLSKCSNDITYVNIDPITQPDIIADATAIPVGDNSFGVAILAEVLEHVPEPKAVLREAYRILRPGGLLLITIPFMYPEHSDPHDYGRYTETYLKKLLSESGFSDIRIERQGTIYAVAASLLQQYFTVSGIGIFNVLKGLARRMLRAPILAMLLWLDRRTNILTYQAWTTGFGIIAHK